jgi:hypothetical protein
MLVVFFMLARSHLPLGKITHDDGSLNQCVGNEMGRFVQTVVLFVALLLGNTLVHLTQEEISARFLLAFIAF